MIHIPFTLKQTRFLLFIFLVPLLAGCSPDSTGFLGRRFHNLNARYNGYFLAREKMKEVEAKIEAAHVNDYNRILDILPPLDTTVLKTLQPDLEEVIKRASFPIARHPKSKWVDDCYVLIGKARYYQGEEIEAIKAFRFVQTTGKDRHARHEALVWLMRTYLRQKDYDAAISVSELFRKERMNEENGLALLLTRAQLASEQNTLPVVIENLERAVPFAKAKDQESRIRFILGQLYQATNQDDKAYPHYARILKKNPPYELGFYAQLNLAQVTELKDVKAKEEIESFLFKLAKDEKNKEYLDKIYYDLAKLQLRQNEYQDALGYLKQSTAASTTNRNQKAYSYLLTAQIHYEHLEQYKLAQAYYDSTLQLLPSTALGYEELTDRKTVLTAFVQQLDIIRTEDSLQALARLGTEERAQRVAQQIANEQEAQRLAAQAAAAPGATGTAASRGPAVGFGTQGGTWYYDNPVVIANARNDFLRTWGERPLQDNWRRMAALSGSIGLTAGVQTGAGVDSVALAEANAQKQAEYLAAIPLTPAQQQASNTRLEEAYFTLGNIYQQRLREPEEAISTFETLLRRFPASSHASEVYYSLYVMANALQQTEAAQKYAAALRERFPTSKYTKLIDQPDFLRTYSAENAAAHALYDSAFVLYNTEAYAPANAVLEQLSEKYPGNDIPDQVAFLRTMIVGRTQPADTFKAGLEQFIQQYPESKLLPKAKEFLTLHQRYESGELAKAPEPAAPAAPVAVLPQYKADLTARHSFVVAHSADTLALSQLIKGFEQYNSRFHPRKNLTITTLPFNEGTVLLVITPFPDFKGSQQYAKLQTARSSPLASIKGPKFATFVISDANLAALQQLRDIEQYVAFFEKNYQ